MAIYLVRNPDNGLYKIGFTVNVAARRGSMYTWLPHAEWIDSYEGTRNAEDAWHRYFQDKRTQGEWFTLTDQDIAFFIQKASEGRWPKQSKPAGITWDGPMVSQRGITARFRSLAIGECIEVGPCHRDNLYLIARRVGIRVKTEKFVGGFYVTRIVTTPTFDAFTKSPTIEHGQRIPFEVIPPPPGFKHISDAYGETLTVPVDELE